MHILKNIGAILGVPLVLFGLRGFVATFCQTDGLVGLAVVGFFSLGLYGLQSSHLLLQLLGATIMGGVTFGFVLQLLELVVGIAGYPPCPDLCAATYNGEWSVLVLGVPWVCASGWYLWQSRTAGTRNN